MGDDMTYQQEEDLKWLKEMHSVMLDKKYRDGAKKHGGDLLKMTTRQALEEALEENLDQYVYIMKGLRSLDEN